MKKIALLIGANNEAMFALNKAKEMGYYIIGFDANRNAMALKYCHEHHVLDITRPDLIIAALGKNKPSIVLPIPIGKCLITHGKLNDYYGLSGVSAAACEYCVDKFKFHSRLQLKGLRNTNCYLLPAGKTELPIIREFPVIIKPRYGSGSNGLYFANNMSEMNKLINDFFPCQHDYIIENRIEGTEYGVDAIILNGKLTVVLLRKKLFSNGDDSLCIGYLSIEKNKKNISLYAQLEKILLKIQELLNLNNCLLHADLIIDRDSIFLIELSPRPSGHYLHDYFTIYATGIDSLSNYINFVEGNILTVPQNCSNQSKYLLRFWDSKEQINHIKLKRSANIMGCTIIDYKVSNLSYYNQNTLIEKGYVILQGDTEGELLQVGNFLNHFTVS